MSIHGICFDNGQSGRCNHECEQFTDGGCDVAADVIEGFISDCDLNARESVIKMYYNDVELFVLRGKHPGITDEELIFNALMKDYGYNKDE